MAEGLRTEAAIAKIVTWSQRLEQARGKSRWGGGRRTATGVSSVPFCILPDDVVEFLLELDRLGLMRSDYRHHLDRLRPAIDDPGRIQTLGTEECLLLLTYHVRTDRFVDGHLARALDRGDLTAILDRLGESREGGAKRG